MRLAADVGGTKTLVALAGPDGAPLAERRYENRAFPDFAALLADFLAGAGGARVEAACLAVAAPVAGRRLTLTNLPWELDADALAQRFGIGRVAFINDFEAVALGLGALAEPDCAVLQEGRPDPAAMALVLGAGTGMGVAWLSGAGGARQARATEAGHLGFAPASPLQDALLGYLRGKFGRVSWERVLSGPGLADLHAFLLARAGAAPAPCDAAAVVERARGGAAVAREALDLFIECYGAFAGDLALAGLARGGVYIAGGIAPRIAPEIAAGGFLRAFRDKGRFAALMREMPVRLVLNPAVGLLGALEAARRL